MPKRQQDADATTYLLRNVPIGIWRRAKAKAILEGRSIRDVIIDLLDRWAEFESGGFVDRKPSRKRRK
jgi:hypothetical protein